jgi:hypothetical protein
VILHRAAIAAAGLLLVPACPAERGSVHRCTCSYLTDFDDPATHPIEVCAQNPSRAEPVARGCAQAAAPAPIQACTCQPSARTQSCSVGDCFLVQDLPP